MRVKRSCGANKVYLEKTSKQEVLEACWELDELKYGIPSPAKRLNAGILPMTSIRQAELENEEHNTEETLSTIKKLKKYIGVNMGAN